MKIKPLHNHVVIKQQDETETMYGNIIVPDAGKKKPLMGAFDTQVKSAQAIFAAALRDVISLCFEADEVIYPEEKTIRGVDFAGTKALFNQSFTLLNPDDKVVTTPQRKFNKDYADYEWAWYLEGNRDASEIAERAKIWKQMMVPTTTEVNSNYGYLAFKLCYNANTNLAIIHNLACN